MIYIKNNELKLSEKKIKINKNGIEEESYIGSEGIEWWEELSKKHDNIEIIEVTDVIYTEEELERFEEIKNFNIIEQELAEDYIKNGDYLVLKKSNRDKVKNFAQNKENKTRLNELEKSVGTNGKTASKGMAQRIDSIEERLQTIEDNLGI